MTAVATEPRVMTKDEATAILRALKFRVDTDAQFRQAVWVFQDCYRLGPELAGDRPDSIVGPHTTEALARAELARRKGQPTCSAHFSFWEFACKCQLTHAGCRGVYLVGELVDALEVIRAAYYRDGLQVVSGYRCPGRNAGVKGAATDSQHQHGAGADLAPRCSRAQIRKLGVVSGIGYSPSSGRVVHVDVRHASAHRAGGTRAKPTEFPDGR